MVRFEQATAQQMPAVLDFLGTAFSAQGQPENFSTLLPKLYCNAADSAPLHTLLYEDNVLAGVYCLQVSDFLLGGQPLRVGWVGSVCVAQHCRGKGYLAHLMQHAEAQMHLAACDIAVLGGQRQRYERFGYAPTGTQWEFELNARNLRGVAPDGLQLIPLSGSPALLQQAHALYQTSPVVCMEHFAPQADCSSQQESFLRRLQSWRSVPYAVVNHDIFVGYCSLSFAADTLRLLELCLPNAALLPQLSAALVKVAPGELILQLYPWQQDALHYYSKVAERTCCVANHSYRVFHWQPVAVAAVALAGQRDFSASSPFSLQIADEASLRFAFTEQGVQVESLHCDAPGDLCLAPLDAMRFLFGADSALVPQTPMPAFGMFPLPLAFPWCDGI